MKRRDELLIDQAICADPAALAIFFTHAGPLDVSEIGHEMNATKRLCYLQGDSSLTLAAAVPSLIQASSRSAEPSHSPAPVSSPNTTITITIQPVGLAITCTSPAVTVTASSPSGGGSGLPSIGSFASLPLSQAGTALVTVGAFVVLVFGVRCSAAKNAREGFSI